jgi:hypothetical protein
VKIDDRAVREWVLGVLAGIYQPEPDEEIYEWAERTMRIPATENEEMAGMLWTSATTPYVRTLLEWAKRPGKGEFWVRKSSQVGITMAILILICWMIVHRPGNIAYALDSVEEARKLSRTRLQRWILENKLLQDIGEESDSLNNLTYFFRSTTVYVLGAYSVGGWANKSIALFILDELDKHPYIEGEGTTVTLARERCKRPKNAKIIGFSTPGETDQITTEFKTGTMEEIRFPFPCCGHEQALKKENLVFSTREFKDLAGQPDLDLVSSSAYFKCELCGGKLLDHQKMAAMQACQPHATNPKARPGIRSMQLWDAYSPFVTFGQIAVQWIQSEGNPALLERLYRGTFGEQFDKAGRSLRHQDILDCRGTYERGTIPFTPIFFCAAIDLQKDVQKATKLAVDAKGNFFVIDWTMTLVLDDAIAWCYEPSTGPDGAPVFLTCVWIDEGHRPMDVRRACLAHLPLCWPVKGRSGTQMREIIATSDSFVDGEPLLTYHIAEDQFKWQLLNMIADRKKRLKKGDYILTIPIDADDDDSFIDEMCNEHPIQKKNQLGRTRWEWKTVGPNDYWDTVKYCIAQWTVVRPAVLHTRPAA